MTNTRQTYGYRMMFGALLALAMVYSFWAGVSTGGVAVFFLVVAGNCFTLAYWTARHAWRNMVVI
ncbi:hypothetical protein [Nocardia africana]